MYNTRFFAKPQRKETPLTPKNPTGGPVPNQIVERGTRWIGEWAVDGESRGKPHSSCGLLMKEGRGVVLSGQWRRGV